VLSGVRVGEQVALPDDSMPRESSASVPRPALLLTHSN
jgi:hypothetical protein